METPERNNQRQFKILHCIKRFSAFILNHVCVNYGICQSELDLQLLTQQFEDKNENETTGLEINL